MSAYLSAIIQTNPESFKEAMLMMNEDDRASILKDAHTFRLEARSIVSELAREQGWAFEDNYANVLISCLQALKACEH